MTNETQIPVADFLANMTRVLLAHPNPGNDQMRDVKIDLENRTVRFTWVEMSRFECCYVFHANGSVSETIDDYTMKYGTADMCINAIADLFKIAPGV